MQVLPAVMPALLQPLLDACSARSQQEASRAVVDLCQQDDVSRQHVVDLGGLLPLVSMLTSDQLPKPLQRAAAHAMFDRSISNQMLSHMLLEVLQQLLEALDSPISERQQIAALAIFCICKGRPVLCQQMSQHGPFDRLLRLLAASQVACQMASCEVALQAIWCICMANAQSQQQLLDLGGMQLLISLLDSSSEPCKQQALEAVANLCSAESGPQHAHACQQIVELGGLQPLVYLLSDPAVRHQERAVTAVADICSASQDAWQQVVELGGMQPLVDLLSDSVVRNQERAVTVIAHICSMSQGARWQTLRLGALQPLIGLLESADCRKQAAHALAYICISEQNARNEILSNDQALAAIADVYGCSGFNKSAMCDFFRGQMSDEQLLNQLASPSAICQEQAVRHLAGRHCGSGQTRFEMQALAPLTNLLSSPSTCCQEHALRAIAAMCTTSLEARYQLSKLDTLQQLIHLLSSPSGTCQELAVEVLAAISIINHHGSRHNMVKLNCLQALNSLPTSLSAKCKQKAAQISANLANTNASCKDV